MANEDEDYDLLPTQLRSAEARIAELERETAAIQRLLLAAALDAGGELRISISSQHAVAHSFNIWEDEAARETVIKLT